MGCRGGDLELNHDHIHSVMAHRHSVDLGFSAAVNQIVAGQPNAAYWLIVSSNNDVLSPGALAEVPLPLRAC